MLGAFQGEAGIMKDNEEAFKALCTSLYNMQSADEATRLHAEQTLQASERSSGYGPLLLRVLGDAGVPLAVRVGGSIMFKHLVSANWQTNVISNDDKVIIKSTVVDVMLVAPPHVQRQLSSAISSISLCDFPNNWESLLPELVKKLDCGDFNVIKGVLTTAESITRRYRHEFQSETLWLEIKYVLGIFAQPLTSLFVAAVSHVPSLTTAGDVTALRSVFECLEIMCGIFYSLNFQDLPEFFEDHMEDWFTGMHKLIQYDNSALSSDSDDEAGILENVHSQICNNVAIYAQKYDEEFSPYLQRFVEAIWGMLLTLSAKVKNDLLVSNAIGVLSSIAKRPRTKHLFDDQEQLKVICEKVIIPNMILRDVDEELFEDNAEEYIRRDVEGSDNDTRRRAACDLVRALCVHHEQASISIFSAYVNHMLQLHAADPKGAWKQKDTALFLVTSLAVRSQTGPRGATKTSELINIPEFFATHVLPDLREPVKLPVLRADALKFVITFRQMLGSKELLPLIFEHLCCESYVVHSYACMVIDRMLLAASKEHSTSILNASQLGSYFVKLFGALHFPGSSENEYIMKSIMRVITVAKSDVQVVAGELIAQLTSVLASVAKNPSRPHFNHFLFESIGAIVRFVCEANNAYVTAFEQALFPPFTDILQKDVVEFLPYVFQILSQLLELQPAVEVPDTYMQLFPHLLAPVLWERTGNIPPLVRLIQAFLHRAPTAISADKQSIQNVLGVFQKLIASKMNDHEGFYLVSAMIEYLPPAAYGEYLKTIFTLLFQRLQSTKTGKFVKGLLVFFSLIAVKLGAEALRAAVEGVQHNLFELVQRKLYIAEVQKVSGRQERKICAVGMTRICSECPIDGAWPEMLRALVTLIEMPEEEDGEEEDQYIDVEETASYQAAYVQLVFAGKQVHDPCATVTDVRANLAVALSHAATKTPNRLGPLIGTLSHDVQERIQSYLVSANISSLA